MICSVCEKEFVKTHGKQKYCSNKCYKINHKKFMKKYNHERNTTEKRRERDRKFRQSDKGKAYFKKYYQSDRGKEALKKYRKSDKGKAYKKTWNQSDKGKESVKEAVKKYRQTDRGKKILEAYRKKFQKEYRQTDKGKEILRKSQNKFLQSDKGKSYLKKYRRQDKVKEYYRKYLKERTSSDPKFKLISLVRNRLYKFLTLKKIKKTNKTFKMIGCTPEFLEKHLEKQFKPGMNWQNHTVAPKGWHVDHRIALSTAKNLEEVEKLMHYTNLQPMWGSENIRKGNK